MKDLINREELLISIDMIPISMEENRIVDIIKHTIQVQPNQTVEARPHKQGWWNYAPDGEPRCSICNKKVKIDTESEYDFCPFCGAEMEGAEMEGVE